MDAQGRQEVHWRRGGAREVPSRPTPCKNKTHSRLRRFVASPHHPPEASTTPLPPPSPVTPIPGSSHFALPLLAHWPA